MKIRGLRLPLLRKPDPVLTLDELDWIEDRCTKYIQNVEQQMKAGLVSESVIRGNMDAESVRSKVRQAISTMR